MVEKYLFSRQAPSRSRHSVSEGIIHAFLILLFLYMSRKLLTDLVLHVYLYFFLLNSVSPFIRALFVTDTCTSDPNDCRRVEYIN